MSEQYPEELRTRMRSCTLCIAHLPMGSNPIFRIHQNVSLLIVSQAPGSAAHQSSIPWDDPGGNRLRDWMGLSYKEFYDTYFTQIGILPVGLCYPGKGKGGDLPPRPECAPKWHRPALSTMPNIQLTLLVGRYAHKYYLGNQIEKNVTETVRNWEKYTPSGYFPLPHPSPRNRIWMQKNSWFEQEVLEQVQRMCKEILKNY